MQQQIIIKTTERTKLSEKSLLPSQHWVSVELSCVTWEVLQFLMIFRQLQIKGKIHRDSPKTGYLTTLHWTNIKLEQDLIPGSGLYHWSQWEIYYWLQWEQDWAQCIWICKNRSSKHPGSCIITESDTPWVIYLLELQNFKERLFITSKLVFHGVLQEWNAKLPELMLQSWCCSICHRFPGSNWSLSICAPLISAEALHREVFTGAEGRIIQLLLRLHCPSFW